MENKRLFKRSHTLIKHLYKEAKEDLEKLDGSVHTIKGWITSVRTQTKLYFIGISDGSHAKPFQLVLDETMEDLKNKIEPMAYVGATICATGKIIKSPAKGQLIEMKASTCDIIGPISEPQTFKPAFKGITMDTVRNLHYMRSKFKFYRSAMRIRSKLSQVIHEYFHAMDIHHIDPSVITTSDCEGAGETFQITNLLKDGDVSKIPLHDKSKQIDFSQDFFGKRAFLTVSSQLLLEGSCCGMSGVYTTNPSFRAEPSKTTRHLASFTHVEWELAFINLKDLMDFSEDLVTHCIQKVRTECVEDLEELNATISKGIIARLSALVAERFARITYDEAIDLIHKHKDAIMKKFKGEIKELPKWGDDLGSHCEGYIAEVIFNKPTFVYNYPRDLKSFYMKQNPPHDVILADGSKVTRYTVSSCDLLMPNLGELIGSSLREDSYDKLTAEMTKRKMDMEPLKDYVELRKDASTPTGGAGMGFERLVGLCTFMKPNIRDTLQCPVAYGELYS
ncbi:MAG: asparaginyl-tRNA synthetase [Edafosvirus sp.]|uniref:asparagine--tRNA ligase n=1 Tax=Edafosvirus sp. TaxID=2487765 RepID=A0A3G4ZSP7_9VIRU|nr:MAG: asparaginyl-tRNA synthetase [Edafosvirus sp.]